MNYYDENDNRSQLYAGVATVMYVIVVAALLLLTYLPISEKIESEMMVIEIIEEPKPEPKPVVTAQAPRHENLSTNQNSQGEWYGRGYADRESTCHFPQQQRWCG